MKSWKEAAFVGYFGPIGKLSTAVIISGADHYTGVGTLYWTSEALEYLPETPNRQHLREVLLPINYFLIVFSVLIHGSSISIFQASRSIIGKGHPEPTGDDPIPIRPGADIYISPSHIHSRNDLSISRTTTRRQSAREYLSSHVTLPSAGAAARPDSYRSQLDLALERSNSRRTGGARDYLERARTISQEDYDAALHREDSKDDDPKTDELSLTPRATSLPTSHRSRSSNSISHADSAEPVTSESSEQHVRVNSGGSTSGNGRRASRLDWIRRGRLARGEPVSEDEEDEVPSATGDPSNRV